MIVFISFDLIIFVLAIVCLIAASFGVSLTVFLWNHIWIIAVIFAAFYLFYTAMYLFQAGINFSIIGVVVALIHAGFPPAFLYFAYRSSLLAVAGGISTLEFRFNWLLVLALLNVMEYIWHKAISSSSYIKLIFFSLIDILLYINFTGMIRYEGF